ncbi:MAG: GGDEF and EAL domain-containing protein [Lachnospiraceae bacterium]|nr:GGDEF and EAL domain-containing protein [Lachnospiraceae bacterium]
MEKVMSEEDKRKLDALFQAFSTVAEGTYVFLCDMEYDYSRWSKTAVDTFGLPDEYMSGAGEIWEDHIHPEDREAYRTSIASIFAGRDCGHDIQYRALKKDLEYVVCTCRGVVISDGNGNPKYFGGSIRNHGAQSYIDNLSGLRNQYGFFEDLQNTISRKQAVNVIMLGIGKFTDINEMFGYHFGNLVLQKFGRYLHDFVGNKGCVYRLDGTKFAIISSSLSIDEMKRYYRSIKEHFQRSVMLDGKAFFLYLNAGILALNEFEIDDQTAYACLNFAYGESKVRRQGDIVEFTDHLTEESRDSLERLHYIRNSVVRDCQGFYLLYQPFVDAKTEKMVGAEALIRWKNDIYGMVSPDHFIPVLERDPLFERLGRWILKTALVDAKALLEKHSDFIMNVNLSYTQLEKPDFCNMVMELLQETGYPADHLCLEITERCKLLDMSLLKNVFAKLRSNGVKFALDDFGTGFSSLGIAKELTFDTIKIDRSFVMDIEEDMKTRALISKFTEFASSFDAKVCVEGIETAGMRDILQKFCVTSFQGYFYSKPVALEELMKKEF